MAEEKKSIIVYADWMDKFEELNDDEAGKLIKHFFRYVNDLEPTAPDRITKLSFIDIEKSLKRDLVKWNKKLEGRSIAGKASAEKRKQEKEAQQNLTNPTNVDFVQQTSTNPTDSVNDNVTVNVNGNVNDILLKKETKNKNFDFRKNLIDFGFKEKLIDDWLKVRKTKKATNTETAFNKFIAEVQKANKGPNDILEICISKDWKGFQVEWLNNIQIQNFQNGQQKIASPTKTVYEFSVDRVIETYTGDS